MGELFAENYIVLESQVDEQITDQPIDAFKYLNGKVMCAKGQVRSALAGYLILNELLNADEYRTDAYNEWLELQPDVNKPKKQELKREKKEAIQKRCVAANLVYAHFIRGELENYVNSMGDFMYFYKPRREDAHLYETNENGFVLERVNLFTNPQTQMYLRQSMEELIRYLV